MLLGSRIIAQRVTEEELREKFRAVDDGRSFWEHAEEAGYEPGHWQDSLRILDDLVGWIELHIEQARVLQDTQNRLGVVNAIAGYVHADVTVHGRGDHAGATPMDFREDAGIVMAECMLELERLAKEAGKGTVGTVGEIELRPNLINAVPGQARFSLDIRGVDEDGFRGVVRHRRVREKSRREARHERRVRAAPDPVGDAAGRARGGRAGGGGGGERRAVYGDALGRGSRHDEHRGPHPE